MFGFYRLAAIVPKLKVADCKFNTEELRSSYAEAAGHGTAAVVFPELCVTGCSCGDLFFQQRLLNDAEDAVSAFAASTAGCGTIALIGFPLRAGDALYNAVAVISAGKVHGIVPKTTIPNRGDTYEKRHFHSGRGITGRTVRFGGGDVPFGTDLLFDGGGAFRFGVEIGDDLYHVVPPSSALALNGARAILRPTAESEYSGVSDRRRETVKQQSARCVAAYVSSGAGIYESTTDAVFAGQALIADNGRLAAENTRFAREAAPIYADIDFERLGAERLLNAAFADSTATPGSPCRNVALPPVPGSPDYTYADLPRLPFVPEDAERLRDCCRETLDIQCAALAKRWEYSGANKLMLGISGGLDSTQTLLAATKCCELLGRPATDVIAITMPGFGTSGRTYRNSVELCRLLGVDFREIDIKPACLQHFADIGHDPDVHDVAFENAQARERTQILMDLANKCGGLVIGTGDLSEVALGWCTYNGDHMAMYAVNGSIPKTLLRPLIRSVADHSSPELAAVLRDVTDTPVSPELLPAKNGEIAQKTEELVGPYELHDFFLYHLVRYGAEPEKIQSLAESTFDGVYAFSEIETTLKRFLSRFFTQQYKRSCSPDGPRAGELCLSPRSGWRMPSDAAEFTL